MADRYEPVSTAGAARAREPVAVVGDRSTVDLIKDIATNIQGIIRSEIRLANVEMKEKTTKASRAGIVLAGGGVLVLYALGFLFTCIYQALNIALRPWLSALLVFAGLAIIGGVMLSIGRSRLKRIDPKPQMTVQAVKEDVQWLRSQTR